MVCDHEMATARDELAEAQRRAAVADEEAQQLARLEKQNKQVLEEAREMRLELQELQARNKNLVETDKAARAAVNDARNQEALLAQERRKAATLEGQLQAAQEAG